MVGLGNMGGRIARRIRDADLAVLGFDVSAEQAARAGVPVAASLADLVEQVDVVLFSLPDSSVVEAVVFGDDGVLAAVRAGQIVVDLSTAAPSSTTRINSAFAERGVDFVDAGISGGAAAAEQGTLTIMAGGSPDALERVRPILEAAASRIYHMGAPGSGHAAKLLNNFLNGIS